MFHLPLLNDELSFPPLEKAHSSGLLAAGGDLSLNRLILAYSSGIFPWFNTHDPFLWWSPDPRFILFTEEFKLSKRQERYIRKANFYITANTAFIDIIKHCASVPRAKFIALNASTDDNDNVDEPETYTNETWITPNMIIAYEELFRKGFAHSVEVWQEYQEEKNEKDEEKVTFPPRNNMSTSDINENDVHENKISEKYLGKNNTAENDINEINQHENNQDGNKCYRNKQDKKANTPSVFIVKDKTKYQLVGGLYGVRMGHVFCGESMFHLVPEASRAALSFLITAMKKHNMPLLDSQQETPHMERVGGHNISRKEYLHILQEGLRIHGTAHARPFLS